MLLRLSWLSLAYALATGMWVDSPCILRTVHEKARWGCWSILASISLQTKVITSLLVWNLLYSLWKKFEVLSRVHFVSCKSRRAGLYISRKFLVIVKLDAP